MKEVETYFCLLHYHLMSAGGIYCIHSLYYCSCLRRNRADKERRKINETNLATVKIYIYTGARGHTKQQKQ